MSTNTAIKLIKANGRDYRYQVRLSSGGGAFKVSGAEAALHVMAETVRVVYSGGRGKIRYFQLLTSLSEAQQTITERLFSKSIWRAEDSKTFTHERLLYDHDTRRTKTYTADRFGPIIAAAAQTENLSIHHPLRVFGTSMQDAVYIPFTSENITRTYKRYKSKVKPRLQRDT